MYVCICNAITDKEIRAAAKNGTTDLSSLQAELGVASGCGSCEEQASKILAEYRVGARRGRSLAGDFTRVEPKVYVPAFA